MKISALLQVVAVAISMQVVADEAQAAEFTATGQVAFLRIHDSGAFPISGGTTGVDRLSVTGFSSAGTCQVVSSKVVIVVRDDERGKRMLALATAAMLAGKNVSVSVDDTEKGNAAGACLLRHLTVGP